MADSFRPDSFTPDATPAPPAKTAKPEYRNPHGPVVGGILDTLGVSGRPGARTPADVLANPRGLAEHAAQFMVEAPLITAAGLAAPAAAIPAWAARAAMAGGLGGLKAMERGEPLAWPAFLDALTAGLTEGVVKGAAKVKLPTVTSSLKEVAERVTIPRGAYEWATRAPREALAAIRSRLPSGKWLNVPSLSSAKLSVEDAVEKLAKQTGKHYEQARLEVASELSRLDAQRLTGPKPLAGAVFKNRTSPERFAPPRGSVMERVAARVVPALDAPITRGVADAAATQKVDPAQQLPAGAVGVAGAADAAGSLWNAIRHLVPAR